VPWVAAACVVENCALSKSFARKDRWSGPSATVWKGNEASVWTIENDAIGYPSVFLVFALKVEIWSDVVCPWCYIGKRRFEAALEGFEHRDEVEVVWKSFELDPSAPTQRSEDLADRLATKYGVTREQAQAMNARVMEQAAAVGLEYHLDIARNGNTFDAHRLIHLAAEKGLQAEATERFSAAYFTEGRPIGDRETLVELAAEVGIDRDRAEEVLRSDEFAANVRQDQRDAAQLGISAVPCFVIDRRYGISGAQPPELILQALNQAWTETQVAATTLSEVPST
jgi:predicted DsbA family dithiol-disulfide isomerase